jgi:hypothetical protein
MIHYVFPFTFKDKEYTAGCHVISGRKRQFHITPYDEGIKAAFGHPIIIVEVESKHFNYGSTPIEHLDSSVLAHCLASGLMAFQQANPEYS